MHRNLSSWLIALGVAAYVYLFLAHDWTSCVAFAVAMGFIGYTLWLNPARKQEITRKEFEALEEQTKLLKEQLTNLRVKIGFQRTA